VSDRSRARFASTSRDEVIRYEPSFL
jgi:hypothetical protein